MRRRRIFMLALVVLLLGAPAFGAPLLIGVLGPGEEPRFTDVLEGLRQGLQELGLDGKEVRILDARVPRGDRGAAAAATRRLLAERVAVLFVIGSELTRRAREVSADVPIVFITPGDPVAAGVVARLGRPGGSTTGMTFEYPELTAKRLELIREVLPAARRVLLLYDSSDGSPRQGAAAAREAGRRLGLTVVEYSTSSRDGLRGALDELRTVDAVLAVPGGATTAVAREIIQAATGRRVPVVVHAASPSTAGALLSYGASDVDVARQAARLVERILRGTPAGVLPVERPTHVELVVDLRVARALGVAVPASILVRADRVLE